MLFSCAKQPAAPVVPGWLPEEMMVEALKRQRALEQVGAIQSEVRARFYRNGVGLGTFAGALAFRPPDSMRLRLLSPFGPTVADMVRVVGRTEVYVPSKKKIYVGWTPSFVHPPGAKYSVETAGRLALVAKKDGVPVVRHVYDPVTGDNTSIEALSGGEKVMEVRLGDYKGGMPGHMKFIFSPGLVVDLELLDPKPAEKLDDRLFHPFEKEGLDVQPLEALGFEQ